MIKSYSFCPYLFLIATKTSYRGRFAVEYFTFAQIFWIYMSPNFRMNSVLACKLSDVRWKEYHLARLSILTSPPSPPPHRIPYVCTVSAVCAALYITHMYAHNPVCFSRSTAFRSSLRPSLRTTLAVGVLPDYNVCQGLCKLRAVLRGSSRIRSYAPTHARTYVSRAAVHMAFARLLDTAPPGILCWSNINIGSDGDDVANFSGESFEMNARGP